MKWILLTIAGLFEIEWAIAMKYSDGFTQVLPSILTAVGYLMSIVFLSMAMKHFSLGMSYAIWTGIGIIGTTLWGILVMKEAISPPEILCIAMIASGIIGLKLLSAQ